MLLTIPQYNFMQSAFILLVEIAIEELQQKASAFIG